LSTSGAKVGSRELLLELLGARDKDLNLIWA